MKTSFHFSVKMLVFEPFVWSEYFSCNSSSVVKICTCNKQSSLLHLLGNGKIFVIYKEYTARQFILNPKIYITAFS